MKRQSRLLLLFLILLGIAIGVVLLMPRQSMIAEAKDYNLFAVAAAQTPTNELDPLPGDCIDQTPDGGTEPVCCISGYVYLGGKPIADAKITVETDQGKRLELTTQIHAERPTKPYYRLALTAPPLDVKPGDQILLQVEYGEYTKQLAYRVQPGGQQVDFVIPKEFGMEYQVTGLLEPPGFDPHLLNQPNGIANDNQGNVYILDPHNARVLVFTADGSFLRQWGRFGSGPGQLRFPTDITFDPKDNTLYVVDNINQTIGAKYTRIQKFSVNGLWLGQLEVPIGSNNSSFNYGKKYLVVDASSTFLFLGYNDKIYKLNNQGEIINSWGTLGSADGQFYNIRDIALDNTGALYVVDSNNDRIQKFTPDGVFLQKWGTAGNGDGQFAAPTGISITTDGTTYIADSGNHRVQWFTSDGNFIAKVGSQGNGLFNFNQPQALSISNQGLLFVADTGNHRLQALALTTATPQWRRQWGSYGTLPCVFNPINAVFDSQGFLFAANFSHACVSKLFSDGSAWPPLTVSEYHRGGLASDRNDNLYVTDSTHDQVFKFDVNRTQILTITSTNALVYAPGIVIDSQSQMYVTTVINGTPNNQIDKFDSTGQYLESWQSYGTPTQPFLTIRDIAIDQDDQLYVATTNKILKFNSAKTLLQEIANPELANIQRLRLDTVEGNLLVIDRGGKYYLQKFAPDGTLVGAELAASNPAVQAYPPVAVALMHQYELFVITQNTTQDRDAGAIQIYRPITNTLPIATIQHRSHIATIYQNETLTLHGMGQDSDATQQVVQYEWRSDKNDILGTTATLEIAAAQLQSGDHKITFRVQDDEGDWSDPVVIRLTVSTLSLPPPPILTPPPTPDQVGWTFLLYLAGDYDDGGRLRRRFEEVIHDLQAMILPVGVNLALQFDGPQSGDTQRWLIQPGPEGTSISTQQPVNNNHEAMMDTPPALTEFVQWGQAQFTNTHYYLSIADHGQAIRGIAWDYTSDQQDDSGGNGSAYLRVQEIAAALDNAAIKKLDILHLDACSMNLLEVAYELRNAADLLISSQYLAWDLFPYRQYIEATRANTSPRQVAKQIVDQYADGVAARQLPYTISALQLGRVDAAKTAFDQLITALNTQLANDQLPMATVEALRNKVQTFETDGDYVNSSADLYIDLLDWLEKLQQQVTDNSLSTQITDLTTVLQGADPFVYHQRQQSGKLAQKYANGGDVAVGQSHGLSLFYPIDTQNQAYQLYSNHALFAFTQNSPWVTFLDKVLINALDPGQSIDPLPLPATLLESNNQLFLPLITR